MSAHLAISVNRSALPPHAINSKAWGKPAAAIAPIWDTDVSVTGAVTHFAQDQEIYGEGDAAHVYYKVASGVVRNCKFIDDGRRQIEAFYVAGDLFGFEAGTKYQFSTEAVCDCTLVAYRRRSADVKMQSDDRLTSQIYASVMRNLSRAQAHILLLGRRTALEKVAAFLCDWADRASGGKFVSLEMTRQDIGDYLGLTIETVSRMMSQLERQGLIELSSARQIKVNNPAALRELNS